VLLTRGGDTATGAASSQAADGTLVPVTPSVSAPRPRSVPVHVDAAHLPQLLLPADAVSTVLASPGMIAGPVQSSVAPGAESVITPIECTSTWSAGKTWTYQASGFLGMARQDVAEKPTHAIVQAVIAFPDAAAAHASYAVQVKAWGTCQFRTVTAHLPGAPKDQTAAIGGFTEADGVAVLQITPDIGLPGVVCQRALTVAGNVVADVRSCSPNVADTGKTVGRDIAAKVTSGR
jgi:serine/threonine-protein kinase